MPTRFGSKATVILQLFDNYEAIKNRCILADYLNETSRDAISEVGLDDAMNLLRSIKIRADLEEEKYVFKALALARISKAPAYFEVLNYSEEISEPWFYGSIVIYGSIFEGKIMITPTMQSASLEMIGG